MRVLVPLSYDLSSMAHGRNLRIVNLLRELNDRCDLTCLVSNDDVARVARRAMPDVHVELQGETANHVRLHFDGGSTWLRRAIDFYGCDHRLVWAVQRKAASVDTVFGFGIGSAIYVAAAGWADADPSPRLVCDLIDDPYLTWRSTRWRERFSLAGIKSLVCLQMMQRHILSRMDDLVVVGPKDATYLSRAMGKGVSVIPNGVHADEACSAVQAREPLAVFTGVMDFPPNEAAADYLVRRIWPHVQRVLDSAGTDAHLAIVGANPSPRVKRLAQMPGVTVTGRVKDVRTWLRRARVAVAPMVSGSGIKNKILEACASGCPVVTTPLGGEGLRIGEGVFVANDPRLLGRMVADLLIDEARARAAGQAGWGMVRKRYSWGCIAEVFLEVLQGGRHGTADVRMQHRAGTLQQIDINEEALYHAAS